MVGLGGGRSDDYEYLFSFSDVSIADIQNVIPR